jgi:hypothetical protein
MIIGYDFWADGVYYDSDTPTEVITIDNDGMAFDNCNPIGNVDNFTLANGSFDEFHTIKDSSEIDNSTEKTSWTINTVLLAKFQNDLVAGTLGVGGLPITSIEVKKRKKGEEFWQTFFSIDYDETVSLYNVIDKFIESEEDYEYCLCPIAINDKGDKSYGNNTTPQEVYISYDHAHIFDNTDSFDLIYNLKLGNIVGQIGANQIDTMGSEYPYVIYGQSNYLTGNLECLLVSEESAVGSVDVRSEKILRDKILAFLKNKQYKVLKNADGLYMLIKIINTPTLIPNNEILGVYQISFDFVQVGNINDVKELSKLNLQFDYSTINKDNINIQHTKAIG